MKPFPFFLFLKSEAKNAFKMYYSSNYHKTKLYLTYNQPILLLVQGDHCCKNAFKSFAKQDKNSENTHRYMTGYERNFH